MTLADTLTPEEGERLARLMDELIALETRASEMILQTSEESREYRSDLRAIAKALRAVSPREGTALPDEHLRLIAALMGMELGRIPDPRYGDSLRPGDFCDIPGDSQWNPKVTRALTDKQIDAAIKALKVRYASLGVPESLAPDQERSNETRD